MVLVTGGAGYIGSHTAELLLARGHRVVVLDDLSTGNEWAVPCNAEFIRGRYGDLSLLEHLFETHKFQGVIHFAGSLNVAESVAQPLEYYQNNVTESLNLLKACSRFGINRFIFSSSAAVYGQPDSNHLSEDIPLNPINPYGRTKMIVEQMLADFCRSKPNFSAIALRYFNVGGNRPDAENGEKGPNSYHLIKVACETACGVRPFMKVFGKDYSTPDGTCIRDYIHVLDLADAHLLAYAALDSKRGFNAYNCGYGSGASVLQVIDEISRISNRQVPWELSSRRPGDPAELVADASKIRRELNWKPAHASLTDICATALNWEMRLKEQGPPKQRRNLGR